MESTLPKCKTHQDRTCEFFCKQCEAVICGKCLVSSHKKHDVEDLEDLWKSKKEIIDKESETVRNVVTLYQQLENDISLEEEIMKEKYQIIENDITMHGEKLEAAVRKAKESYLKQAREKKGEDLKFLEKQKETIKGNIEKARKMELAIPDSNNTCEEILAFCRLDIKELPEVPKLSKVSPPEFAPNMDLLQNIIDNFGNLAI
ncbi:tripartite motif-containing protein 3-like [Saccostrea echinata]|uniref:tripartite motif-containing protein 3-like n=1 Tax=Saccostrea echinata TaxID=191078 RepID=UPI002A80A085|nr:tripartite motif-containing protein 3-like [Saccostrea echinata]